jgi:hypothetical protein
VKVDRCARAMAHDCLPDNITYLTDQRYRSCSGRAVAPRAIAGGQMEPRPMKGGCPFWWRCQNFVKKAFSCFFEMG